MILSPRTEIATRIYCSTLQMGRGLPDIETCLAIADQILKEAKETQGFFVDVEKYNKAVEGLRKIDNTTDCKWAKEIVDETLKELGES